MRSGQTLLQTFQDDPLHVVLDVLKEHAAPMRAGDVKAALVKAGLDETLVGKKWSSSGIPAKLKIHPQVAVDGLTYAWSTGPQAELTAAEAVQRLVAGAKLKAAERKRLGEVALSGLHGKPATAKPTGRAAAMEEAERHRHLETKIRGEFLRALAELAMDLEELIGNEASARALIERVRTTAQANGLEPIGDVGETAAFDDRVHHPIAGSLKPETSVIVMRPGYFYGAGKDAVLVAKARVIEQ